MRGRRTRAWSKSDFSGLFVTNTTQFRQQLGNDRVQVGDQSVVGDLLLNILSITTEKSGASGSLFTHTMVCASFMPAWCWMDPLTPRPT